MKCSIYIATSTDGYIATTNGSVDWQHTAGDSEADKGIPLFGKISQKVKLKNAEATAFSNESIQIKYNVNYL